MLDAELLTNCVEIKLQSAKSPYIRTHSGHHFYYQAISADAIEIDDIAQALSNICRFAGHLDDFYSVAQHSVLVSRLVPPELALEALLHDASEAYCQDIPAPLKAMLPDYRDIEASVDNAIRSLFGLPMEHSPEVKRADLVMLATERRDLGIDDGDKWDILDGIAPTDEFAIHPLNPRQARQLFIARFNELWRVRVEQRRQEIFGDTTP
ncbi:HD family hydrolase [Serratia nevei]|uniref:HD family hydrolase n=1 Tax=Serratia nevei TaxID=2703794 RepID=UPI003F7F8C09